MKRLLSANKSALYHNGSVLVKALSGPLTFILLAERFTEIEQGLFFSFLSLGALQIVFEAGISTSIVQFMLHEKATSDNKDKYFGFLKLAFFWCFVSAICVVLLGVVLSNYIYGDYPKSTWQTSLYLYLFAIGANLLFTYIYIAAEGNGYVEFVYKYRFYGAIASSVALWLALINDFGLYALSIANIFMLAPLLLNRKTWLFIIDIKTGNIILLKSAFQDIKRLQLKLMLVWATGYLYWNSPVLIIFKFVDPIYAGKFGLTFSLLNAVSQLGQGWVLTRRALLGSLVAKREYKKAKALFTKCSCASTFAVLGVFIVLMVSKQLIGEFLFFPRTLNSSSFMLLCLFFIILTHISNLATYTRCFKEEPLFYVFLIINILVPSVLLYAGLNGVIEVGLLLIWLLHIFYLILSQLIVVSFERTYTKKVNIVS